MNDERCLKCGRPRPEVIADPSCDLCGGYCIWERDADDRPCANHPPPSTLASCFCTICGAWKLEGRPLVYVATGAKRP